MAVLISQVTNGTLTQI